MIGEIKKFKNSKNKYPDFGVWKDQLNHDPFMDGKGSKKDRGFFK